MHQTLCQFEEDLHKNEVDFGRVLEQVSEQEMAVYHDMQILDIIQRKNQRTQEVLNISNNKMAVIEESQRYMMNMLDEMENDLQRMLCLTRNDLSPLYDDQELENAMSNIRLSGATGEARLYQRLDNLSKEMTAND